MSLKLQSVSHYFNLKASMIFSEFPDKDVKLLFVSFLIILISSSSRKDPWRSVTMFESLVMKSGGITEFALVQPGN